MQYVNRFLRTFPFVFPALFLTAFFFLTLRPGMNEDTWFDIVAGGSFLQHGIFHTDIFSYTAYGREWFPYEWFFQVCIFLTHQFFGSVGVMVFTAFFTTTLMALLYFILRGAFKVHPFLSGWLVLLYYAFTLSFFVPRPQLFALVFFLANLGLILQYVYTKKNLLFLTLPITLLWANMHATVVLGIYLFAAYTCVAFFQQIVFKSEKSQWQTLGIYTIITSILTVLPPLGILQYRLLYLFWQYHTNLTNTLTEWQPITNRYSSGQLFVFLCILVITVSLTVGVSLRNHLYRKSLWLLPLTVFLIIPFMSYRNIMYTNLIISIFLGFAFSSFKWSSLRLFVKLVLGLFFTGTFIFFSYVLFLNHSITPITYTPIHAAAFIKQHNIQGHMLNELGDGGYLLYTLYPEKKVFIDLRFDLYACCEIPVYENLLTHANDSNQSFAKLLKTTLFDKYSISYALINTQKGTLTQRIGQILQTDPAWELVYWDDRSEIFVKKDGKNTKLLQQFGANVATPYGVIPFPQGKEKEAFAEYQKMIHITDSAHSRNVLGYLYYAQKNYAAAKTQFEKAISLDPNFAPPYANLAELYVQNNDPTTAISLYEQSLKIDPFHAYIYLRLAQLYLQYEHDTQQAQAVLQDGIAHTQVPQEQQQLENALMQLQNSPNH